MLSKKNCSVFTLTKCNLKCLNLSGDTKASEKAPKLCDKVEVKRLTKVVKCEIVMLKKIHTENIINCKNRKQLWSFFNYFS